MVQDKEPLIKKDLVIIGAGASGLMCAIEAGAYGIQGLGAVMGLPLNALVESLKKFGVKVLG